MHSETIKTLDSDSLKILKEQLSYELMMNKKFSVYVHYFVDAELKSLCHQSSQKHKQNYETLLYYLNSISADPRETS